MDAWFVYVARCTDGTLYAGIARDVAARIAQHDAGKGARYTRGRGPLTVLVRRRCPTKGDALRLEAAVKRLSKAEKLRVAASRRRMAALAKSLALRTPRARRGSTSPSRATPAA
ncbi:MAG TPA: GIY-YIG nuclease family protein [Polyangiaceae bacterium]